MSKFLVAGILSLLLTTGDALTAHAAAVLPTLPQKQVNITMPTVNGSTLNATCSTLQAQLNAAAALDVNKTHEIILATGTTCVGPYKLPSHTGGTGWILIKGTNYASLPPSGTRVSPSDAALMPTIMYGDDGVAYTAAIAAQTGAQRYRIIGINIVQDSTKNPNWGLVVMGYNNQNALNTGYLILDRVLIRDTDANHLTYRGIYGEAELGHTAMIDSYVSGIKGGTPGSGYDSQAWLSVSNPGPILIQNNFLEAAGENIMFCGSSPVSEAVMPRDATIRLNTLSKHPNWWGQPTIPAGLTVKTLLELKCGQRVLIDGNDFVNMPWNDGGNAFRLTVRAEGGSTFNDVSDITITNNLGKNVQNWINSFGSDDGGSGLGNTSKHSKRWNISNNLVYGLGWSCMPGNGCDGHFYTVQNGGGLTNCTDPTPTCQNEDITISHNTVDDVGSNIMQIQMPGAVGLNFKDNLINSNGSYGIFGGGGTGITVFGTNLLNYGWPGPTWTFVNNRIAAIGGNSLDSSYYPQGTNSYPADVSSFLFTNRASRDYTLQSTSPAKGAASDGTDQGVNFAIYNAARAGGTVVSAPTPDTAAPSVPTGLTATALSTTQINLSWSASTDNVGVTGYRIYRNGIQVATSVGTTYSNTSLTPSTTYSYTVVAYDSAGNVSTQSASASATTQSGTVADTTAPTIPAGLTATAGSSSQINLSWTAATDAVGVAGYRIYRNGTQIATTATNSYSDTALTPSTTYTYTVAAYDLAGNVSTQSAGVSATTQAAPTSVATSWTKGFNFRATSGYVTDGANETYVLGEAYPLTRNNVTFGWTVRAPSSFDIRNRNSSLDRRLAGLNFTPAGTQSIFRVDLPAPGTYTIGLALGDASYATGYTYAQILDNTTVLATIDDPVGPAATTFDDATGMNHTAANWPSQNRTITTTFASTILYIKIGTPTAYTNQYTELAHMSVSQVQSQTTPTPDTTSPSISLTAPAANTTVSSSLTVSASASDNVGVSGVQFKLDGSNLGVEDTTAPYSITWDTTATANGSHTLTATARDAAGNQTTSTGVSVTVSNTVADTAAPTTPSGLTATAISTTQINLSWSASTDNTGVTGYKIYRGGTQIATAVTTSYSDASLTPSTAYTYTVAAYDLAGNTSVQSASASATTQTPPTTSTKFILTDRVQATATLNVRATASAAGTLLGSQSSGALGTVIGGPTNSGGFNWWNVNYDTGVDGWSVEDYLVKYVAPTADTTAPSTPTNLTATALSTTQINLSWNASTDTIGVTGYRIYRNGTQIATTATNSYSNTGLSANTAYTYTVAAYDAAGNTSAQSSNAIGTTLTATVTTPTTGTTNTTNPTNTTTSTNTNTTNTSPTNSPATPGGGSLTTQPAPGSSVPVATTQSATPPTPTTSAPSLSLTRTLYQGAKGTDVKNLQIFLVQNNYLAPSNTTGFYGPLTTRAVQKYQCAQNIVCSGTQTSTGYGMVGAKTRAKLNGSSSSSYVSTSTLTPAQADSIIALLQSFGADAAVVARVKVVLGR